MLVPVGHLGSAQQHPSHAVALVALVVMVARAVGFPQPLPAAVAIAAVIVVTRICPTPSQASVPVVALLDKFFPVPL